MARPQQVFAGLRQRSLRCGTQLLYRRLQSSQPAIRTLSTSSQPAVDSIHRELATLRSILDSRVVGQASVKEAVLLGLLAGEHVYIEGPPGVAKTYMSELISEFTGLSYWFYQLHRDTRLNEIVGEAVITKETTPTGDIIRQDVIRGGILTCEIAVLDDISRAPGEALNVLLRILNERKFGNDATTRIPLLSAIATGNPAQDDAYFAEPLDPATLDRFALQVRPKGLIHEGNWTAVSEVIDMYSGNSTTQDASLPKSQGREIIARCGELVPRVDFDESTKTVMMEFLRVLSEDHELGESNSLLTDRTFLIKAVKILKANAVLNGRTRCEPQDLYAMRYMTTFRIPEKVHEQIDKIIGEILAKDTLVAPSGSEDRANKPKSGGVWPKPMEHGEGTKAATGKEGHLMDCFVHDQEHNFGLSGNDEKPGSASGTQ